MQEELEMMRPQLEEAAKDTVITMEKIKVNKIIEIKKCLNANMVE